MRLFVGISNRHRSGSTWDGWRSCNTHLPLAAMFENSLNHGIEFYETDDLHGTAALRALQRVDFIYGLYQRCPCHSAFSAVRGVRFRHAGNGMSRGSFFLTYTPFFIRVMTVVTDLVFALIWVLCDFSQKIQQVV